MTIDSRFIATSDLESYFVDKDSGEPLSAGIVKFYSDLNRTTPKDVYQLTGSPPNYSFSSLGAELTLSGVGTFQDNLGNNIVPYYFPYQGTPDDSTGAQELYYITVESSGNIPQFTREAWPPIASSSGNGSNETINYIPNGQFLTHTDYVPAVALGSNDVYYYAQGGWSFQQSTGSSGVYQISFQRITTPVSGIDDFPRYAINFVCSSFGNETIHDWVIQWPDVNMFTASNPPGTQQYTFFFAAQSNDSNTYIFDVRLIRNFGTGGTPSSTEDNSIGTVTITPGFSYKSVTFVFPENTGKTLGTNNDDYVAIALRSPDSTCNVRMTDFALVPGGTIPEFFPVETNAEVLSQGVAGWMPTPNPDGSDLYLPLVLTPKGMQFDHSDIGKIFSAGYASDQLSPNEIFCDGQGFQADTYSSIGIPYSRLLNKYWNNTFNVPIWGTGYNFATCYISATNSSNLRISTNINGSQTDSNAGTSGFTVARMSVGGNYEAFAFNTGSTTILAQSASAGTGTASAGTSGFTVTVTRNSALTFFYFTVSVGAVPAAGTYFAYTLPPSANQYYVWFKVNGAGADPAPGGTGIEVDILSTYSAAEVSQCVSAAMAGYHLSTVSIGSLPAAGTYFYFYANGTQYVVWYTVDGSGLQPSVPGATYIKVEILSTDTTSQVATKTQIAINRFYVGVPDLRGVILRGIDPGNPVNWDLNASTRFNQTIATYFGAKVGNLELDDIYSHNHPGSTAISVDGAGVGITKSAAGPASGTVPLTISLQGGTESRPVNASIMWVIKY